MRELIEEQLTRLYCDQNYSGGNREWYVEENERKKYHAFVFTDGSYRERPKPVAGIGVFWGDGHPNNYSGLVHGEPCNNRAELCAAHHAIGQAFRDDYRAITIISDSTFVKHIIDYPERYEKNAHKNFKDLMVSIKIMRPFIKIKVFLVKGHAGNYGNEEADRLARSVTWRDTESDAETLIRVQKEMLKMRRIEISQRAVLKKERVRRRTMCQLAAIRHGYDLVNSDPHQDVFDRMGAPIGYLSRTSIRRFLATNLPNYPNPFAFMEPSIMNQFAPPMEPLPNDIFSNMGPPIGADPFGIIDPFLNMGCLLNPGNGNQQQFQMWHYQNQQVSRTMYREEQRRRVYADARTDRPAMLVRCQKRCCSIRPTPEAPVPPMMIAPCAPRNPNVNGYSPPAVSSSTYQFGAIQRPEAPVPPMAPCAPINQVPNGYRPPTGPVVSSSVNQPTQSIQSALGKLRSSPNRVLSTMIVEEQRIMVENVHMHQMSSGPHVYAMQRPRAPVPPMTPCAPINHVPNGYRLPMGPVVSRSTNQPMQKAPLNQVLSTMFVEEQRLVRQGPPVPANTFANNVYADRTTMLLKCQRSCCSIRPMPQSTMGSCVPRNQAPNGYNTPMAMRPVSNNRNANVNNMTPRRSMNPPAAAHVSPVYDQENQAPAGQRPPGRKSRDQRSYPFGRNAANLTMPNKKVPAGPVEKNPPQVMSTMVAEEQRRITSGLSASMNIPRVLPSGDAVSASPIFPTPASPVMNTVTTSTPYSTQNGAGPLLSTDDALTNFLPPPKVVVTSVHKSPAKAFHGFSVPNFWIFQRVFELTCVSFVDISSETSVVEFD